LAGYNSREVIMRRVENSSLVADEAGTTTVISRSRRKWRAKFGDAFRGVKLGVRGHSSFFVHFFFSALTIAAGLVLGCNLVEWCLLVACIGAVLTAELFNSAIETLVRVLDEPTRQRAKPSLDIAAGAVLLASGTALLVGGTVLLTRFVALLRQ
jgi:diacylglycerol kinase